MGMVLLQAGTVAVLGYGVGAGLGSGMGWIVASQGLAFSMPWYVATFAFVSILSVCGLAAWLSLRQVFKLEPAIVFKA
jgi:putative ABC transport system permease protein